MRFILVCGFLLLAACQSLPPVPAWQSPEGRQHPDLGVILDLRDGRRLSPDELVDALAPVPRVLVGEQHDNPDHHALELWLLQALEQRRSQGSLLMEMLTPSQQARVDAVRGQSVADLPKSLDWEGGWDWSLYGPLVRHGLAQPYPLLAANLDRDEILAIYRQPPRLEGAAATAPAVQAKLTEQVRQSHCGLLPESQFPPMVAVQQQRDRRMAERLLAAPAPALLVAGSYHARRDLGAPLHLADLGLEPDQARVVILAEAGKAVDAAEADFVWYTAAVTPVDHCAEMRKQMHTRP